MRRWLCGAATAAIAAATPARGAPAQIVTAIAAARGDLHATILVGRSGQVYLPDEAGGWRRDRPGGVADDVVGALRGADGTLYVVAGRAPLYARVDGVWRLHSLGVRRRARASTTDGIPIVVAGRQLFTLEGDRWRRLGLAPTSRVQALWAASATRIYLALDNGSMRRRSGRTWTTLEAVMPETERVAMLTGIPGRLLVAIGDAGTIMNVGATTATPIAIPAALTGFQPTAAGSDGHRHIYLAGPVAAAAGAAPRSMLALLDARGTLQVAGPLPALAGDDRYTVVLPGHAGAVLVASYHGVVAVRDADGAWVHRSVITTIEPVPPDAARGPAHTR